MKSNNNGRIKKKSAKVSESFTPFQPFAPGQMCCTIDLWPRYQSWKQSFSFRLNGIRSDLRNLQWTINVPDSGCSRQMSNFLKERPCIVHGFCRMNQNTGQNEKLGGDRRVSVPLRKSLEKAVTCVHTPQLPSHSERERQEHPRNGSSSSAISYRVFQCQTWTRLRERVQP